MLSVAFIVALWVPCVVILKVMLGVSSRLYVAKFTCNPGRPGAFFGAATITSKYLRAVGQDVSLGKCVLLNT